MLIYKVDAELNRVADTKEISMQQVNSEYDLGISDRLTVFSTYNDATLWVDNRLIRNNLPLVRINKSITTDGEEFLIVPMSNYLKGSIYLLDTNGITKYNLTFYSNSNLPSV